MPTFTDVNNININKGNPQMVRGQSPSRCMNHNHHYHNSNIYTTSSNDFYQGRTQMVGFN